MTDLCTICEFPDAPEKDPTADPEKDELIISHLTPEEYRRLRIWADEIGCREGDMLRIWLHNAEREYREFKMLTLRLMREVKAGL